MKMYEVFSRIKSNTKVRTIQVIVPHLGHLGGSGLVLQTPERERIELGIFQEMAALQGISFPIDFS